MARQLRRKGKAVGADGTSGRFVAVPEEEANAAVRHWNNLDIEGKLQVLRFEDAALVEKVFSVQQELCMADLQCYMLGVRGQDAVRSKVGMDQFAMETDEDATRPTVFYAQRTLVERDDFFEHVENHLGSSIIKRPGLKKYEDWRGLFEPRARSWPDFMHQVLRLVEQAILKANDDASSAAKAIAAARIEEEAAQVAAQLLEEEDKIEAAGGRKSSKRNQRRKKNTAAVSLPAVFEDADTATEINSCLPTATEINSCLPPNPSEKSSATALDSTTVPASAQVEHVEHTTAPSARDSEAQVSCCDLDSVQQILNAASVDADSLKFDWSAEGPPIDAAVESAVELQVDWSADSSTRSLETRWTAWLSNGMSGVAAEWAWVAEQSQRAFIKNTFVDVVDVEERQERHARARSLPATIKHNACIARRLLFQKQRWLLVEDKS